MHIKQFIMVSLSALLCGCIGEDPDAAKTTTTTPDTTTPTPTATPAKTTTPGAIGTEPAIYKVRTTPNRQLQNYFQGYAKANLPLDERDQDATDSHLADIFNALPQWSADTTKWTDQFDTPTGTPPDSVNIHVVNDKGGSVIAADGTHIVQNLQMDHDTGLFIPAEKIVLATKITMDQNSWVDVRRKMGSASFDMKQNSIIEHAESQGMTPVIPSRKNRKDQRHYDKSIYALRHLVENAFLHLNGGESPPYMPRIPHHSLLRCILDV